MFSAGVDDVSEALAGVVSQAGGICLDDETGLLVADRFGRSMLRVDSRSYSVETIRDFLTNANSSPQAAPRSLVIHLVDELFDHAELREAAARVAASAVREGLVEVRLHLLSTNRDWSQLIDWFAALRNSCLPNAQRGMLTIDCPFSELDDHVMESLFRLGTHCRYMSGWWPGCDARAHLRITENGLERLAAFGFYVPLVWYVHAENVGGLRDAIQRGLVKNYNAGFSLPLISSSPFYGFDDCMPGLPDPDEYATLLADVYASYPHYDLAFAPIRELAELVANGGWDTSRQSPVRSQVLLRPKSPAVVFRQIPGLGRMWLWPPEIAALSEDDVRDKLAEFQREEFALSRNPVCGGCQWVHLCGGMDVVKRGRSSGEPPSELFDANCYYRMVFLEMFLRLRLRGQ